MYKDYVVRKALAFMGYPTSDVNRILTSARRDELDAIVEDAIILGFNIQEASRYFIDTDRKSIIDEEEKRSTDEVFKPKTGQNHGK